MPTNKKIDKGYFNILENASKILPQGQIVQTAKKSWNLIWRIFITELAPQSKDGTYERPIYQTKGWIGTEEFPEDSYKEDEAGRIEFARDIMEYKMRC